MTQAQKVDRILFLLESDPKTKHIGTVEQVGINTKDIRSFKMMAGKITAAATVFSFLGTMILKFFGFFKL